MPALRESELSQLRESLTAFSEDAMRRAIEEARDPEKATQIIQRLREELNGKEETFAGVALCVVLGEAGAEAAIPVLLEAATDTAETVLQEAATYALQRMGPSAMTATMAFIESATDPGRRVLAYEILFAASDHGAGVATQMKDFCLARARVETARQWPSDDWDPSLAVCYALAAMGDERVRPILEEAIRTAKDAGKREEWEELVEDLDSGCQREHEIDWRIDWPEQCADWAAYLGTGYDDEKEEEEEEDEEEEEEEWARAVAEELANEFEDSSFAQSIEGIPPGEAAEKVAYFLLRGWEYAALDPAKLDLRTLREALYEWTPRKVSAEPEYFEKLPLALSAFFRFLNETGRLPNAKPFLALAKEARTRLPRLAADPRNWGMAKSLFMAGRAAGFDMTTEKGMRMFRAAYNASLLDKLGARPREDQEERQEEEEDSLGYLEVTQPVRRAEPKVGRNDPCPCGSGKKYKKCCGR
jgi:hypothetical protein